jgi:hypothetical protein
MCRITVRRTRGFGGALLPTYSFPSRSVQDTKKEMLGKERKKKKRRKKRERNQKKKKKKKKQTRVSREATDGNGCTSYIPLTSLLHPAYIPLKLCTTSMWGRGA